MQSIKSTPMGMVFTNTTSGTYAGWCRDTWHDHGDAADMHSVFRHYQGETSHGTWMLFLHEQCCCNGVTQLELAICMSCKQCVSSVVMAKHTWHTWFFFYWHEQWGYTDGNGDITWFFFTKQTPEKYV